MPSIFVASQIYWVLKKIFLCLISHNLKTTVSTQSVSIFSEFPYFNLKLKQSKIGSNFEEEYAKILGPTDDREPKVSKNALF